MSPFPPFFSNSRSKTIEWLMQTFPKIHVESNEGAYYFTFKTGMKHLLTTQCKRIQEYFDIYGIFSTNGKIDLQISMKKEFRIK